MKINRLTLRIGMLIMLMLTLTILSTNQRADTGTCGGQMITIPFTDVAADNIFFCSIAAAYFSGLTNGTSSTTFSPSSAVDRQQMAAFVTRTLDLTMKRGSRRAALNQWWTTSPHFNIDLGTTAVGSGTEFVQSDGSDLWVTNSSSQTVVRVRANDGKVLETWTAPTGVRAVMTAMGLVFATSNSTPGNLYRIDPRQPVGPVTTVTDTLGDDSEGIAFDGERLWGANVGTGGPFTGSVSIVTPQPTLPWSVTTVTAGFDGPQGILYDGTNMWVTDIRASTLLKLDYNGTIIQTVPVGTNPGHLIFDGTNLWVPNLNANTITVIRASSGAVVATLSGNGLTAPFAAAFDGERILVTNLAGSSVSLWKAADLTPIGSFSTGPNSEPYGACSDGLNFWIVVLDVANGTGKLARF